jgi:hypothetical protein
LASGLVLAAMPALAQSDSNGVGGIIRNLDNALNNRNAPSRTYSGPTDNYSSRDYGSDRYSGSSVPPSGYGSPQAEQRRLDELQAQINHAQQQLNQQYRDFYQSQRGMAR